MVVVLAVLILVVIAEAGVIALLGIALHGKSSDLDKIKGVIDKADDNLKYFDK